jgi:hypothetical protein
VSPLFWIAMACPALAQDVLTVWGGLQFPAKIESDAPVAESAEATAEFAAYGLRLLTPPIRTVEGRWLLVNGVTASRVHPTIRGATLPAGTANEMNSLAWDLLSMASLTERWSVVTWVSAGLYSTFADPLSGRDVRGQVLGIVTFDVSKRATIGLGGGYVNLLGVPQAVPAVLAEVDGDRIRFDALLPREANLWFELVDHTLSVGARWSLEGGYFHRGSDGAGPEDVFLRYSVGTVGPALEWRRGPFSASATVGLAVIRRFEVYEGADRLAEFDLATGPAGRLSLALSPTKKRTEDKAPE